MPIQWKGKTYFSGGFFLSGSGRVYKEMWIPATQILDGEKTGGTSACLHATTGSLLVSNDAAAGGGAAWGGQFFIRTVAASSNACNMQLHVTFPAPDDMDITSTASPYFIIEHMLSAALTTAGCSCVYKANYNYVTSGSSTTTGCLATTNIVPGIGACIAGARISGSYGPFPVPAARGQILSFALQQLTACGTDTLANVVGLKFVYVADRLGRTF